MQHNVAQQANPITWVVVADSKRADIYSCHKMTPQMSQGVDAQRQRDLKQSYELALVPDGSLEAGSRREHQLGHAVALVGANTNAPHAHREVKEHFTKDLAHSLARAHEERLYGRLILVAPAKMIGELREQLAGHIQQCIAAVLPKELTHYRDRDLLPHLQDTLTEAHVM